MKTGPFYLCFCNQASTSSRLLPAAYCGRAYPVYSCYLPYFINLLI